MQSVDRDGEYNKEYDRMNTVKSMTNFMRDPTGDMPWEEDANAGDVLHIESQQVTYGGKFFCLIQRKVEMAASVICSIKCDSLKFSARVTKFSCCHLKLPL